MDNLTKPIESVRMDSVEIPSKKKIADAIQAGGWTVNQWEDPPGAYHAPHDHPYDHRVLVVSGEITFTVENKEYPLARGKFLDLPRRTPHSAVVPTGGSAEYWLLSEG